MIKGFFYRVIMKIAHRFNWHYAPPIYPENDIQLWCKWCGFRQIIKRGGPMVSGGPCSVSEGLTMDISNLKMEDILAVVEAAKLYRDQPDGKNHADLRSDLDDALERVLDRHAQTEEK